MVVVLVQELRVELGLKPAAMDPRGLLRRAVWLGRYMDN